MNALISQMQQATVNDKLWQKVNKVYHATNETALSTAEQSDSLTFSNSDKAHPCSLFGCKLWHNADGTVREPNTNDGRPNISPYASNHVVIPATDVLGDPEDYLLPTLPYPNPARDPDQSQRSSGGRIYIEMVYLRHEDVELDFKLTPSEQRNLDAWKLRKHPFVRLDGDNLSYRVIKDVWWLILTPYDVLIPGSAIWELDMGGDKVTKKPRVVRDALALKLVRNLSVFSG
jgi:hypothetical protein